MVTYLKCLKWLIDILLKEKYVYTMRTTVEAVETFSAPESMLLTDFAASSSVIF